MTMLDRIIETKRAEVAARMATTSLAELDARIAACRAPRGFRAALDAAPGYALIAEVKKASPSKGLIRAEFDPTAHARAYAEGGAACLSVLTDERWFQGSNDHLRAVRAAVDLPILRKDFMVDPWQVVEARGLGADAILIIVAALDNACMAEIESAARDCGLDVLIEVHDEAELDRALKLETRLIGVNNRDLKDFSTDLGRSIALVERMPAGATVVAESGIAGHADVEALAAHGIRCFLVGEALMRQEDIVAATRALLGR